MYFISYQQKNRINLVKFQKNPNRKMQNYKSKTVIKKGKLY